MRVIFAAVVLILLSAPVFAGIEYNQRLGKAKFMCTHTSGKEVYDTGDINSLNKHSERMRVFIDGDALTTIFEKGGKRNYEFTKSVLIKEDDGTVRWHLLFNNKPNRRTILATESVSFLMRTMKDSPVVFGLVYTEPLTASDTRLFVRTNFYSCEAIE